MSIASGVTAAITAIATALNARNAPGPSDYQVWLAQGNVGTLADYRTSLIGGDEDFAGYLAGLLTTPPRAGAASEAQAGVTQLATLAEALAGASSTKALSALRHANVHVATSFTDLNSKAASLPTGSIVALAKQDIGGGAFLYRSIWALLDGYFRPITPLLVSSSAVLTTLASQIGYGKTVYPALAFDFYITTAIIDNPGPPRDEWIFAGPTSGFILWRGAFTPAPGPKYTLDNRSNRGRVDGVEVMLEFAVVSANGQTIARDDPLVTTPFVTAATTFVHGAMTNGPGWSSMTFWTGAQNINLLTNPAATGSGNSLTGSGTYQRTLPAA